MKHKKNQEDSEDLSKKVFALGPEYIAVERLGKGTYGTVYKAKIRGKDFYVAIKKIKNEMDDEGIPSTALREIAILKKMKHPNVVNVQGIAFNNNNIELCLEYCRYDLKKLIDYKKNDSSFYNVAFVKNMMYQLLKGVEHLHSHKILHRDLKPQNILVNKNPFTIKLADFGNCRLFNKTNFSTNIGTLGYAAPELSIQKYDPTKCDLWSIGVIIYRLKFNEVPLTLYGGDIPGKFDNKHLDDLVRKLIVVDSNKRIDWDEYFNHPFFKN